MSLLIFHQSPEGYNESLDLGRHFRESGRGKNDWLNKRRGDIVAMDGKRPLYGWIPTMEEIDEFNRSHKGGYPAVSVERSLGDLADVWWAYFCQESK